METKLNQEIRTVLEKFDNRYFIDGVVNKSKVIRDLDSYDADLVKELLLNDELKERFTMEIVGSTVIKVNDLIDVFEQDEYWQNSYTKYSKKIGLTINEKFLDETSEVVLDFPYKDTILKASMSKEDTDRDGLKPDEPFLNEVIARDEIDTLLDKKILVNAKRYTKEGVEEVKTFNEDNLIIKGNNLLALHTIKELYTGKIQLIYLDPPYNTGNDSFDYNDRFNHGAWLTFMKNRLEIAHELLSDTGYIVIQTDDTEQSYLKVLMDSLFGRENYVNTVSVLFKNIAGASGGGEDKRLKKNVEFLTIYAKQYEQANIFNNVYDYKEVGQLVEEMRNSGVSWKYTSVLVDAGDKTYIGNTLDGSGDEIKIFKRTNFIVKSISQLMREENISESEAYNRYGKLAFQTAMPQSSIRPRVMEKYRELEMEPNNLVSIEYIPRTGRNKGLLYEQFYKGDNFRLFAWLKDVTEDIDGILYKKEKLGTFWNYVGETKNVNKEGQVEFPNGKKPERLLGNIIEMTTQEGDLVLDFFMGSASTQATALKMNRNFVGMEQIDEQWTKSLERLQNVLRGDQSGISRDVNWHGGGSFISLELMEKNTGFIKEIVNAKDMTELQAIFKQMMETADFDFRVDLEEIQKDDLWQQAIDDQKRILIKVIDKNQLYYNYSEIDDKNVRDLISDSDYEFNKIFYADRGE
ncbi:site-specific DNA-methyltransferase [Enterococcus songbeiensis]|uniref:site-specific DNA-methyltransferase n=1 Tax=Enterococcus songbeiensis TaxID=2559927 RepID=UPI0010F9E314|nr:site-specific DNA-methyltransferase [Enterococcus songbeiensis]